jgi:hypothetical protein
VRALHGLALCNKKDQYFFVRVPDDWVKLSRVWESEEPDALDAGRQVLCAQGLLPFQGKGLDLADSFIPHDGAGYVRWRPQRIACAAPAP